MTTNDQKIIAAQAERISELEQLVGTKGYAMCAKPQLMSRVKRVAAEQRIKEAEAGEAAWRKRAENEHEKALSVSADKALQSRKIDRLTAERDHWREESSKWEGLAKTHCDTVINVMRPKMIQLTKALEETLPYLQPYPEARDAALDALGEWHK